MQKEYSEKLISIPDGLINIIGSLKIPSEATGLVIFAHGSGSNRYSPRNNYVADVLNSYGLGTLLLDLLTVEEDADYDMRFNIDLLAHRLLVTAKWLKEQPETSDLALGFFGASTGSGAAIQAASILKDQIKAIVSRGGRPDLAWPYLDKLTSPIYIIVGGKDDSVLLLNEQAYDEIKAPKQLEVIAGATHLFEEPGALKRVAEISSLWFQNYLHY